MGYADESAADRLLAGLAESSNAGAGSGKPEDYGVAWPGFIDPADILEVVAQLKVLNDYDYD